MATLQIQKTRNKETVTKTVIDQKQSIEMMQTMLHGSLSTLSYLRNFFAEKAFDQQMYEMSDKIHPYKDYAAGKLSRTRSVSADSSTVMRILRRGRSKRVDMFLDWLEKGVFVALKAGDLRAIQVYVHADPADREKVIETYTFTLKYSKDAGNAKMPAGLQMDSAGNPLVSVEATNSALQTLLRNIMDLCATMPDLPDKRFISMNLFYVEDSKKSYKPKGFVQATTDELMFAQADGWTKKSKTLPELNSLFHNSLLDVTYLQELSKASNPALAKLLPPSTLPENLDYGTPSSRQSYIPNCSAAVEGFAPTDDQAAARSSSNNVTSATIVEEENEQVTKDLVTPALTSNAPYQTLGDEQQGTRSIPDINPSTAQCLEGTSQHGSLLDTQSSNVITMKGALRDMMQPEFITQGDTQTQISVKPPPPPCSETTESPSHYSAAPSTSVTATADFGLVKPILSPNRAKHLDHEKTRLQQAALELVKEDGRKVKKGDIILCQCGFASEDGEMVECTYCSTWQHLHCYGYTGEHDPRLPDEHTCYHCLLGEHEQLIKETLQDLAVKRRAMRFALQHGLTTQTDLAKDMGLSMSAAATVFKHLQSEGYVVAASKSRSAGYRASGKPLWVPAREGPSHDKMLQSLFDPLLHISHHYQLPARTVTQPSMLTQRLLATQSRDMPPPATPASQLRKRVVTPSVSHRDLRAPLEPSRSPNRVRSQRLQSKRANVTDADETPPPKRRATPGSTSKRLKSLQSEYVLDAGGLPSSPFSLHTIR